MKGLSFHPFSYVYLHNVISENAALPLWETECRRSFLLSAIRETSSFLWKIRANSHRLGCISVDSLQIYQLSL